MIWNILSTAQARLPDFVGTHSFCAWRAVLPEGDFPFVRVNPRLLSRTKHFLPLKAVSCNEAGRLSTRGKGL